MEQTGYGQSRGMHSSRQDMRQQGHGPNRSMHHRGQAVRQESYGSSSGMQGGQGMRWGFGQSSYAHHRILLALLQWIHGGGMDHSGFGMRQGGNGRGMYPSQQDRQWEHGSSTDMHSIG